MVLTPLIRGLLGIDVDAPAHRLTLTPHLPPDWDSVRVRNIPFGSASVDVAFRRTADGLHAELTRRGGSAVDVVFSPSLPLGAKAAGTTSTAGDEHAVVHGILRDTLTLTVAYSGGWSIVPPRSEIAIGDRSSALRVVSERIVAGRYTATLEGRAGRAYRVRIGEGRVWRDTTVTFPSGAANADDFTITTVIR
jgi:hypothetical protein